MKKMILKMSVVSAMLMSVAAFADGFVCEDAQQTLKIRVYDETQPSQGTRDAAVMIVSDPTIKTPGDHTIATFSGEDSLLTSVDATYTAEVDLNGTNSDKGGRNIGGTKLSDVQYIILAVDYSFSNPLPNGSVVAGNLTLTRRNGGDDIHVGVSCTRYLKGN